MDLRLFRLINGMAGHSPLLDLGMVILAEWVMKACPFLLAALWFFPGPGRPERRIAVVLTGMAVLMALGLTDLPALFYQRTRPFDVHKVTLLLNRPPPLPSFPSAHLSVIAAVSSALGRRLGRWSFAAWALTVGAMVARVFVGVHYPADVLGGVVIGWTAGAVVYHNRDALHTFAERIVSVGEELL